MSSRPWRALFVIVFALIGLAAPASTHAGGGVAPGGKGGGSAPGGGAPAAVAINVDHTTLPGHAFDFLDFYPRNATVHPGDTVNFHWVESNGNAFHTVTFVPANTALTDQALARLIPGGGAPLPDTDDGPGGPAFNFNPDQRPCGNSPYFPGTAPCNYDGRSVINSGVLFPNAAAETGKFTTTPPLHFSVRMNVPPGIYRYFCLVHGPGMSGTITVAPTGATLPSKAQRDQASAAQFQAEATQSAAIVAHTPAPTQHAQGGHSIWSITAGLNAPPTSKIETNSFSSPNLSIKAGDTVVWAPRGFHTVTFPSFAGIGALSIQCESAHPGPDLPFRGFANCNLEPGGGRGIIPSRPPGTAYTGGFANSGALLLPKPHAWSLTFPKAGTYRYQCLIHWGMNGTITVH